MEFSVPQFTDIEDKIIGPFTVKQFLAIVVGGILIFMFWALLGTSVLFFGLTVFILVITGGIAFVKFNGRPILSNVPYLTRFFLTPRYRLFSRADETSLVLKKVKTAAAPETSGLAPREVASRLKKLAYLLDQQAAEEERLIHVVSSK